MLVLALVSCDALMSDDEKSIRFFREVSNAALAAHDSAALAKTLTLDYNVVTSRNSNSAERSLMLSRLATDWSTKPDLIYRRTTQSVEVFSEWRMASETGTWVGTWTEPNGDKIRLSGSYYAKWHLDSAQWRIRAEIFTPLHCEGGTYCQNSPLEAP